jgi:hypothetical protein
MQPTLNPEPKESSIHKHMPPTFLSPSRSPSLSFEGPRAKNPLFSATEESVLQDLTNGSETSQNLAMKEALDLKRPFFGKHPLCGQKIMLHNLKKYVLMRKLGCLEKVEAKTRKNARRRRRVISDDTWKKRKFNESTKIEGENGLDKKMQFVLKRKFNFKNKHWTVTDFGRVHEPKNLLNEIKQKMKLNSGQKPDLLRDDSKLKSITSFHDLEVDLGTTKFNVRQDLSRKLSRNKSKMFKITSVEELMTEEIKGGFDTPEKRKRRIQKSPPKLKKKSAFHRRLNANDSNLEFLKTNNQLWTDQLNEQKTKIHDLCFQNAEMFSNIQTPSAKQQQSVKNRTFLNRNKVKKKKNFLANFQEIFSGKNSNFSAANASSKCSSKLSKTNSECSPIQMPRKFNEIGNTTLCTENVAKNTIFQNSLNWSNKNKNINPAPSIFFNRSTNSNNSFTQKPLKQTNLTRFLGVKMTKSDGDNPKPSVVQTNLVSFDNQDFFNDFGNKCKVTFQQKNLRSSDTISDSSILSEFLNSKDKFCVEQNTNSVFNLEPMSKPQIDSKSNGIFNTNVITFSPNSIFGEFEEQEEVEKFNAQKPVNPFEKIDLELDGKWIVKDNDLDCLLKDPSDCFKGTNARVDNQYHRPKSFFAFD